MKIKRSDASSNPPTRAGWWFIEIPTRTPHLCRLDEDGLADLREFWQDGYKCWPLEDISENSRLGEILDGLHARPRLFFEIAQAFGRIKVAGPWVKVMPGRVDDERWVRYEAAGWPAYAAKIFHGKESNGEWTLDLEGMLSMYDSLEVAQAVADRRLSNRGYHLVDLRREDG